MLAQLHYSRWVVTESLYDHVFTDDIIQIFPPNPDENDEVYFRLLDWIGVTDKYNGK